MCIKRRDINALAKGEIPFVFQNTPFIVMRQCITMILTDNKTWQYSIVTTPTGKEEEIIDRETARQIIKANRMTLAHSESCGQIYELPGAPFRKLHARKNKKKHN